MTTEFVRSTPTGHKFACSVCGATGYLNGRWMKSHEAGHPFGCSCGRAFSTASGIAAHTRMTREGVHRRLLT